MLQARQRYPHVRFEVADVLDQTAAVLDIACGCSCSNGHTADDAAGGSSCGNGSSSSSKQKCDVVFADIGGNRQLEALLRLLPWVLQQLEPRLLVVKSEELAEAAERQLLQQQTQQQVEEHARLSQHQLQTRQLDSRQLSARGLQLQQDLQQLQGQLQAATVTGSAAGSRVVAAAAFCDSSTSSLSIGAAADSCQQPHSQQHLQQQQESAAAAARGQILNPQAWWDWLEVQCGLNPLLHSGRAEAWYLEARGKGFVRNPLRYPQRFTADGTRICRPHNYDKCLKIDTCRFDHQHCHHCGAAGHTAVDCHIVT
jgi:DNA-binding protein YbaB